LKHLQEESRASVLAAEESAQSANAQMRAADEALSAVSTQLHATQENLTGAQAELARAQGEVPALQRQVDAGAVQHRELQETLNATQQRFADELERQRAAAGAAEERHAGDMRRVLLDVDRERVNSAKLHKELEQARRMLVDQSELLGRQMTEKQQQAETLRQRNGELEGCVAELRVQRDLLLRDVADLRLRLESLPPARQVKVKAGSPGITKASRQRQKS
jgi:chromosome segregation ATPase